MSPKQQKNMLYILAPATLVIIVWIAVSIYVKAVSSTISEPLNMSIKPIDAQFNTTVLKSLNSREVVQGILDADIAPVASEDALLIEEEIVQPEQSSESAEGVEQ